LTVNPAGICLPPYSETKSRECDSITGIPSDLLDRDDYELRWFEGCEADHDVDDAEIAVRL
jgi:hypothetical protein